MTKLLYLHNAEINSEMAHLTQVVAMCNAFKAVGVDVQLVLNNPKNLPQKTAIQILQQQYGNLIDYDILLNSTAPTRMNRIGKYINIGYYKNIIKRISPDVCFVRAPLMMKACMAANANYVYESHNNILHQGFNLLSKYWTSTLKSESKRQRFIKLITISHNLKKFWVAQGVEKKKILPLHDGFQAGMFKNEMYQSEARKQLNLPLDKKIVLYSGSLFADREIENILKLAIELPEVLFVVVGGPEKSAIYYRSLVESKSLTNIEFLGRKPHYLIPQYLYAADVLLALWSKNVPTINYCSPLKLFEYMASGRIIVAHAFPTIKEVLSEKNAILVEPENFSKLFSGVKESLSLPLNNDMSTNARKEALEKYSWKKRADMILSECLSI